MSDRGQYLLAIDPGNIESGWAVLRRADYRPIQAGKSENETLLQMMQQGMPGVDCVAIEQIGHYGTGMPAGVSVFDTCRWIGRFEQVTIQFGLPPQLTLRATVKAHICGSAKAKDGNVAQALADRFAPGEPRRGKGTKSDPGWFYGFADDMWQAYGLGVYTLDMQKVLPPAGVESTRTLHAGARP